MQIQPVSDTAFIQATMTMDAVRMECLAYQQLVEQQKTVIETQTKKIEELEKQLAETDESLQRKEHIITLLRNGEDFEDDREDEVMSAIKAAIDPGDPAAGAGIDLKHGRTIYLPPGRYSLTGARDIPATEES